MKNNLYEFLFIIGFFILVIAYSLMWKNADKFDYIFRFMKV